MATESTRFRLLDAAERLFSESGYDGTSIRAITREAEVNAALVHYHFGTKRDLLYEVTNRIVAPLNARRFALLDRAERLAAPEPPTLRVVLEAFVRPDVETLQSLQERGASAAHFLGRTYSDQTVWIQEMAQLQFAPARDRFLPVLKRVLPSFPKHLIEWRIQRVVAVLVYEFSTWPDDGLTEAEAEALVRRLLDFLEPALAAPPTTGGNS